MLPSMRVVATPLGVSFHSSGWWVGIGNTAAATLHNTRCNPSILIYTGYCYVVLFRSTVTYTDVATARFWYTPDIATLFFFASPLLILLLLHRCFAAATLLLCCCVTDALLLLRSTSAAATLVLCCCYTGALLLLHWCFAAATLVLCCCYKVILCAI